MELKLSEIKRVGLECQNCSTLTVVPIGKTIVRCPGCNNDFKLTGWDYQDTLFNVIEKLKEIEKNVVLKVVCEEVK